MVILNLQVVGCTNVLDKCHPPRSLLQGKALSPNRPVHFQRPSVITFLVATNSTAYLLHCKDETQYPAPPAMARPPMHHLKLQWFHGPQNLVDAGFNQGMTFAEAKARDDLIKYVYIYAPPNRAR